jgi:hypothetical protein
LLVRTNKEAPENRGQYEREVSSDVEGAYTKVEEIEDDDTGLEVTAESGDIERSVQGSIDKINKRFLTDTAIPEPKPLEITPSRARGTTATSTEATVDPITLQHKKQVEIAEKLRQKISNTLGKSLGEFQNFDFFIQLPNLVSLHNQTVRRVVEFVVAVQTSEPEIFKDQFSLCCSVGGKLKKSSGCSHMHNACGNISNRFLQQYQKIVKLEQIEKLGNAFEVEFNITRTHSFYFSTTKLIMKPLLGVLQMRTSTIQPSIAVLM